MKDLQMAPPHTQTYEDAITVTPVSSHEYSASLHPDWTIGAVPHGGYTMAILYRLATTHFKNTHPNRHNSDPMPISMQISFLRRTHVGPVILTVKDSKLGQRTSTIHVTLSQEENKSDDVDQDGRQKKANKTARVVGYITVSDPVSDVGVSTPSAWKLYPPATSQGPPEVIVTEDGVSLPETTSWKVTGPTIFSKFRRVEHQCITFGPAYEDRKHDKNNNPGVLDQWSRLRTVDPNPSSSTSPRSGLTAGNGKWTNETIPFLSDWFPAALQVLGESAMSSSSLDENRQKPKDEGSATVKLPPFWYPTVILNIDFKKRLPPQGVDWIFSRIVTKSVRNGRMDIEVILMDEEGDIVSLCSQVGLVVSVDRNTSGRKYGKSLEESKAKL